MAEKYNVAVLAEKLILRKQDFYVLVENSILQIWRKNNFTIMARKQDFTVLAGNLNFRVLTGKLNLRYWRKNLICGFGRKACFFKRRKALFYSFDRKKKFCSLRGNIQFNILRKYSILRFWLANTNLWFLVRKLNLHFMWENSILWSWRESTILQF